MFLDALGFTDMIKVATLGSTDGKLLQDFFEIHEQSSSHWKNSANWEYKCFTDNVVFGCPPDMRDSEGDFGYIFTTAGYHQLEMTLAGFFLRGGMTYGPLHMSQNVVFGQALLDAYELESKTACFPRVILDKKTMDEVYKHFQFYRYIAESPHDDAILVDEDGQFFLNYLDGLIDGSSAEDISFNGFEKHRDFILDKLKTAANARVLAKYEWSARYHNHVIDRKVAPLCFHYEEGPFDPTYLKVPEFPSQSCLSLSEFMRSDSQLSVQFASKL